MGPFDRFNDRAKRVLALAQDEAVRFNHNYIGTEHLLLGLVREGEGVAGRVLNSLGVELSKVRTAVEAVMGRGTSTTSPSEITLSPRTKKVVELAIDEARRLGHSHIGTEHLLLGLLRESGHIGSNVLESLGVSLDKVRHQVIATLGQQQPGPPPDMSTASPFLRYEPWDRLDVDATRTVLRAHWEAGRLSQAQVTAEHLLLGLIASEAMWMQRIWKQLGVSGADFASRIGSAASGGTPTSAVTETQLLKDVLGRASYIAVQRRSRLVRTEHLLLAIVEEGQSLAATWLVSVGATAERVRKLVDMVE
jgi:ATP-dependent Clp protease ATP-binding subunit ClpA